MTIRQWISKNFLSLIIIALAVVIFLQRCGGKGDVNPRNYSDTTHFISYEIHDSIIISKPQIINTYRHDSHTDSIKYQASTNYDSLLQQYNGVKDSLLAYNIYEDTKAIDTLGTVKIVDTIHKNKIFGRSFTYNLKTPVKTDVINNHIFEPERNKWYVGLGLGGNQTDLINQIKAGVLIQNKRDQIYGVSATATKDLKFGGEVSFYWKIKLHK